MSIEQHAAEAEKHLDAAADEHDADTIARAQVHATLAVAEALREVAAASRINNLMAARAYGVANGMYEAVDKIIHTHVQNTIQGPGE